MPFSFICKKKKKKSNFRDSRFRYRLLYNSIWRDYHIVQYYYNASYNTEYRDEIHFQKLPPQNKKIVLLKYTELSFSVVENKYLDNCK